jgi:hypothetical protein
MPSPRHDAISQLFIEDPKLAVEVLRDFLRVELPADLPVRVANKQFNDRPSTDFQADAVVAVGPPHSPAHAIIVEIQQRGSESKRRQLPRYAASLWLMLRCPVTVLVVCPSVAAATWFRDPVETGLPGYVFRAAVLGPEEIPVLTDPKEIASDPELAALKVMAHGHREDVREIFAEGIERLPDDYALEYYEHVRRMTADSVSRTLEELMKKTTIYNEIAREHEARGEARAVLRVLSARGLDVSAAERTEIAACQDLGRLDEWLRRAVTAESVDDLFQ